MNWFAWARYEWARVLAIVMAVVAAGLVVAGWVGISGASLATEQIPYLASGAVGGLFALGVAATLWLSADLRDEFVKLDEIFQWMQADGKEEDAPAEVVPSVDLEIQTDSEFVSTGSRPGSMRARPAMGPSEP